MKCPRCPNWIGAATGLGIRLSVSYTISFHYTITLLGRIVRSRNWWLVACLHVIFWWGKSRTVAAIINDYGTFQILAFITLFRLFWCQVRIQILFSFGVWVVFFFLLSTLYGQVFAYSVFFYSVKTFFFFLLVWFCVFYAQWLLWDGVDEPTYRFRLVLCGWFRMFVTFMVCRSWRGGLFYTLLARIGMSCVCQTVLSYAPLEFYHNFFFGEWFSTLKKKICKLL